MTAFLGVDLGGTRLRVAIADQDGKVKTVTRRHTEAAGGPEHVIDRIVETVHHALDRADLRASDVRTLGIGLPGPVDPRKGIVFFAPNLPGWKDVPINEILTDRTGIPSFLHHDAHLAAYGEAKRGAAQGAKDVVYVTVSTGVGAGLILNGHMYSGATGVTGELGHIVIEPGGPRCNCGNNGCLEAVASGTAIARMAREALEGGSRTLLRRNRGTDGPTARDVVVAARAGDAVAKGILERAGTALGIGLGTVVMLLSPEVLLLGGSVTKAGPLLRRPMRAGMHASSWEVARRGLRILAPALGQNAGLIGAVEWARFQAHT